MDYIKGKAKGFAVFVVDKETDADRNAMEKAKRLERISFYAKQVASKKPIDYIRPSDD